MGQRNFLRSVAFLSLFSNAGIRLTGNGGNPYVHFRIKRLGVHFVRKGWPVMTFDSVPRNAVEVKLDGLPVEIPAERKTLGGICSYLESVALHQQRILCSLAVDGAPINLTQPPDDAKPFASI